MGKMTKNRVKQLQKSERWNRKGERRLTFFHLFSAFFRFIFPPVRSLVRGYIIAEDWSSCKISIFRKYFMIIDIFLSLRKKVQYDDQRDP